MDEKYLEDLEAFEEELLHLRDSNNRQVNICVENGIPQKSDVFTLYDENGLFGLRFFKRIRRKIGAGISVYLRDSAIDVPEVGLAKTDATIVSWRGNSEPDEFRYIQRQLSRFIDSVYKDMSAKGTNVLFLSIGAVKWKSADEVITSPLIIFPIKLIRKIDNQPVGLEFVDDDIFINECFYRLFTKIYGVYLEKFPLPKSNGVESTVIDIDSFDIEEYFNAVEQYVESCKSNSLGETTFEFDKNLVAIARYTHDDICMYRDIMLHRDEIASSPLIRRVFGKEYQPDPAVRGTAPLRFVLKYDSVQREITDEVINGGTCVKVQGPPGTGKTQTIANILACAISANKRVLFVSKKVPALEEVYSKLPSILRPFVLKIESEKESLTVQTSPNELHRDFNRTLKYVLPDVNRTGVESKDISLNGKLKEEAHLLDLYSRALFGDELKNGYSLYDAICRFSKRPACTQINFDEPSIKYVLTMDMAAYEQLGQKVKSLQQCFAQFTDNGAVSARKTPYFGIKEEKIYSDFMPKSQVDELSEAHKQLADLTESHPDLKSAPLGLLLAVASINASDKFISRYLSCDCLDNIIEQLDGAIGRRKVLSEQGIDDDFSGLTFGTFLKDAQSVAIPAVKETYLNYSLPCLRRVETFFADSLINRIRRQESALRASLNRYYYAKAQYGDSIGVFTDIMGEGVFEDEKAVRSMRKAQTKLKQYFDIQKLDATGFALKGFGAKSALSAVEKARKKTTPITAARLIEGAKLFGIIDSATSVIKQEETLIASLIENELDENTVDLIKLMFDFADGSVLMEQAIRDIRHIVGWADATFGGADNALIKQVMTNGKLGELVQIAEIVNTYVHYSYHISACNGLSVHSSGGALLEDKTLLSVATLEDMRKNVYGISKAKGVQNPAGFITDVKPLKGAIERTCAAVLGFARENTDRFMGELSAYHSPQSLTVADLGIFVSDVCNAQKRNAVYDFARIINSDKEGFLQSFFAPFVVGSNDGYRQNSFEDIFEHSFFGLFIDSVRAIAQQKTYLNKLVLSLKRNVADEGEVTYKDKLALKTALSADGAQDGEVNAAQSVYFIAKAVELFSDFIDKFGLGDVQRIRDSYAKCEDDVLKNNQKLIALRQIERIRKLVEEHKNAFSVFEGDKSTYRNVRLLFKNEAKIIMQLKNCFIMSPSSISSLMGNDEFSKFDVAIFDEASQIEPQYLIPVLFRTKQCVIIGDEHQMPPIRHFVKNKLEKEDDDYIKIESGLDLVSGGRGAFEGYSLRCHYRSQSESLIAYSQRYYPDMITFPSKMSFNSRMGIRDELVQLEWSDEVYSGVNKKEAQRVLEVLSRHFEVNPQQSVGVLTFGDAQAQYISKLIGEDAKLRKLTEDKGEDFFVKPIAKLQGREIDHVIMSMTYGRNERGQIVSLGDLSRSYGEQIFNVAASRAKYMLTVIHSFTVEDIASSNVYARDYLADFLRIVRDHSANGDEGCRSVSSAAPNGFIGDVCGFLVGECGIDSARIMVNYGATQKSLRIPIVILDEDCKAADIAIFCDVAPIVGDRAVNYIDFAIKYRQSLVQTREWNKTVSVSAYDWVKNGEQERANLKDFINKSINNSNKGDTQNA